MKKRLLKKAVAVSGRRRIAGAEAAVDLEDRLLRARDLVLEQRVPERRADVRVVEEEHLDCGRCRAARSSSSFSSVISSLQREDHLARLRVLHVVRGDAPERPPRAAIGICSMPACSIWRSASLVNLRPSLTMSSFDLGMPDVARRLHADQVIGLEELGRLAAVEDDRVLAVEVVEQVLGGHAERAQQHRGVELPPPVDADEEDVLRVELEVDPRAAVRDDARRVEELAAGVRLALVVVEEDARRAVELRDDDPLGAVHHERPVLGHERDLAEVDLLLLHVLDRARAALGIDVPDHELHRDLERRGEGHAALMALVDVVLGLAERVAHELERRRLVEVLDREDGLEDRLQPLVLALPRAATSRLQELLVRPLLDVDQVRDVDDLLDAAEASAGSGGCSARGTVALPHYSSLLLSALASCACSLSLPSHAALLQLHRAAGLLELLLHRLGLGLRHRLLHRLRARRRRGPWPP